MYPSSQGLEDFMLRATIGLRDFPVVMNRDLPPDAPHARCDFDNAIVEVAPDATFEDLLAVLTEVHARIYAVPPRVLVSLPSR
jgi:hypothetical protein